MKTSHPLKITVLGFALLIAAGRLMAGEDTGWYVALDAGGNFLQDTKSKSGPGFGPPGTVVAADPGPRVDLMAGYRINKSLAVELEGGFTDNRVTSIGGITPLTKIYFYQYPLMANVVFKQALGNNWQVSLGGGVGAAWTTLDIDPLGRDTDVEFAYQFKAGISYSINENFEIGLTYKFLGTTDHSWTVSGIPGGTEGTMAHSILATLTLKF